MRGAAQDKIVNKLRCVFHKFKGTHTHPSKYLTENFRPQSIRRNELAGKHLGSIAPIGAPSAVWRKKKKLMFQQLHGIKGLGPLAMENFCRLISWCTRGTVSTPPIVRRS